VDDAKCAFIQFVSAEDAAKAVEDIRQGKLNAELKGAFKPTQGLANLFFTGFPTGTTKEQLVALFAGKAIYGEPFINGSGKAAYIQFENVEEANEVVKEFDGQMIEGSKWAV
jgi:hypothetical protein